MVDSKVKCSACVLLEVDSDSGEMLLEQHALISWRDEKPSLSVGKLGKG